AKERIRETEENGAKLLSKPTCSFRFRALRPFAFSRSLPSCLALPNRSTAIAGTSEMEAERTRKKGGCHGALTGYSGRSVSLQRRDLAVGRTGRIPGACPCPGRSPHLLRGGDRRARLPVPRRGAL